MRQWAHAASCSTLTDHKGGSPVLGTVQHHVPTHVLLALQTGGHHRLLRLGQGAEQGDGREGVGDDGGDTSSGPRAGAWVVVSPSSGLHGLVGTPDASHTSSTAGLLQLLPSEEPLQLEEWYDE